MLPLKKRRPNHPGQLMVGVPGSTHVILSPCFNTLKVYPKSVVFASSWARAIAMPTAEVQAMLNTALTNFKDVPQDAMSL